MILKSCKKNRNKLFKATCLSLALLTASVSPAFANVTRVSELVDVDPNVWAYKALKELVEKYDVLEGYPDKTFRGNKPATRYEMAQALYEVLKVLDISNMEGPDAEKLGRLTREFDKELSEIRNRLAALEGRVSALEAGDNMVVMQEESWTDRIKLSGDLTSSLRTDWSSGTDNADWGTRARLGVDAVLIADDPYSGGILGDGIAHIRMNAANGGPGTYSYPTAGNNLDDIMFDASNPSFGSNNSLFGGRVQDSRMDVYLEQAYYTQVFNFRKSDPCSNEVREYPNFFAVADLGQQDLFNTFHKSLVREDSLDGFMNQRILHGMVGASDATTEAFHLGLNWLGDDAQGERIDECGNVTSSGLSDCGDPLPGFFQALSLDYAFAAHKVFGGSQGFVNTPGSTFNAAAGAVQNGLVTYAANDPTGVYTTSSVWDNNSHSVAANLLFDLPSEFLGTGLLTAGASYAQINMNQGIFNNSFTQNNVAAFLGNNNPPGGVFNFFGDRTTEDGGGATFFAKYEQFFGKNRTFGLFADYAYATNSKTNWAINGPFNQIVQGGLLLNTTFMPQAWNFNKDQLGLAYSYANAFSGATRGFDGRPYNGIGSHSPTSATAFSGDNGGYIPYNNSRSEHIVEMYYRKYITEHISLTPDLLFNLNGNGDRSGISGTLRATFKLPNWNDGGAFDQFGYRDWSQRIAKYKASHSAN